MAHVKGRAPCKRYPSLLGEVQSIDKFSKSVRQTHGYAASERKDGAVPGRNEIQGRQGQETIPGHAAVELSVQIRPLDRGRMGKLCVFR